MRKFCTLCRAYHSCTRIKPALNPAGSSLYEAIYANTAFPQPPDCVPARGRHRTYSPEVTRRSSAISRIIAVRAWAYLPHGRFVRISDEKYYVNMFFLFFAEIFWNILYGLPSRQNAPSPPAAWMKRWFCLYISPCVCYNTFL